MCFDIISVNIRVSIRVRGLHLVFWGKPILPIQFATLRQNLLLLIKRITRPVLKPENVDPFRYKSDWWFGTCFIFPHMWDNPSH